MIKRNPIIEVEYSHEYAIITRLFSKPKRYETMNAHRANRIIRQFVYDNGDTWEGQISLRHGVIKRIATSIPAKSLIMFSRYFDQSLKLDKGIALNAYYDLGGASSHNDAVEVKALEEYVKRLEIAIDQAPEKLVEFVLSNIG